MLSLKTSDLRAASRVAAGLDAAYEELLAEDGMDAETMGRVLAKVRDDALEKGAARRAARPADLGYTARADRTVVDATEDEKQALLAEVLGALAAHGPVAVSDDDLIDEGDDPAAIETLCDTDAEPEGATPALIRPALRSPLAVSRDRAILLDGIAGYYRQAARRNDRDLARGAVDRALQALELDARGDARAVLERLALGALAEAHRTNAGLERGDEAAISVARRLDIAPTAVETSQVTTVVPSPPTATEAAARQDLVTFGTAWNDYRSYKSSRRGAEEPWTEQTARQNEKTKDLWIECHGDRPLDQYSSDDAEEFKEALGLLPRVHGKNPEMTGSMRTLAERTRKAMAAGDPIPECLSEKTIKRHMSALSGFYQWILERKRQYHYRDSNIFRGYTYKVKPSPRGMWSEADLEKLFRTPIWTGRDPHIRSKPGPVTIYDADYWLPLIAVYHGLRQEEIAQLRARDIKQVYGVWCIDVNDEDGRVKTSNSVRLVPVHKTLIELGWLRYVDLIRTNENDHLWPSLKRSGPDKKYAAYYTRTFCTYCRQTGLYDARRPFHALRATFRTFLEESDAKSVQISQILGHSLVAALGVGGHYVKRAQVMKLKEVVDLFAPGIDLSRLSPYDPDRHRIE